MKINNNNILGIGLIALLSVAFLFTSCKNGDVEFDDYDYQTVYFANQTPVRTLVMGDDVYSTELDNLHKFKIMTTLGGVWSNKKDRKMTIAVDNSLCDGLQFSDGSELVALPSDYYQISSNEITIGSGDIMGGVEVQLTDAFFNDNNTTGLHYVLPVRLISAEDSILDGFDYCMYALKYINKWTGCWLSYGTDEINLNGVTSTVTRQGEYMEDNELRYLTTTAYNQCSYALSTVVDADGTKQTLPCNLILTFDDNGNCVIITNSENCTASGSGTWEYQGAKQAWGNKDRDQLSLKYTVTYNYTDNGVPCYKTYNCTDTLVMRDRQSKLEEYSTK